jgi:Family of unknown function (DUF5309)
MASKVGNAFSTYFATGNREDLSNAIYNIDPFDTPVMSAIRRRNTKNRIFDWQTEHLPITSPAAPDPLANAQVEGFLLVNKPAIPTIRQNNVTQISERDATVTGSQEESDAAGKGSEMAHQMAMTSKVLKSDIEVALCSRQARQDGSDNGTTQTARVTEGFCHWLGRAKTKPDSVNINGLPGGAVCPGTVTTGLPVLSTDAFPAPGAPTQLTEEMLGDAMQQAYTNGASPTLWIVPPGPKRTVSTFVGRSTSQVMVGKTEVVSTVDVIATDFGRVKCIPSRWLPPDVGLLVDPDYAAVAFFRSFRQYLMARIGDAESRMIVVEWGLEMRNSLAHVMFNGITA